MLCARWRRAKATLQISNATVRSVFADKGDSRLEIDSRNERILGENLDQ